MTKATAILAFVGMGICAAAAGQSSPAAPPAGNSTSQSSNQSSSQGTKTPAQPGQSNSKAASQSKPQTQTSSQAQPRHIPLAGDPFFAPVAISLGPQSLKERFEDYAVVTFGPRALVGPAFSSLILMAHPPKDYPHYWRDGGGAFGRNYGAFLARASSLQAGRFFTGTALHEDFRYRPSPSHNFIVRGAHAIAFTVVDRSALGESRLALANFAGAAAGGFVGRLYLPAPYNSLHYAGIHTAEMFGTLAGQNLLREFAPDIDALTRKLHLPFPRIPVPGWWVPRKN